MYIREEASTGRPQTTKPVRGQGHHDVGPAKDIATRHALNKPPAHSSASISGFTRKGSRNDTARTRGNAKHAARETVNTSCWIHTTSTTGASAGCRNGASQRTPGGPTFKSSTAPQGRGSQHQITRLRIGQLWRYSERRHKPGHIESRPTNRPQRKDGRTITQARRRTRMAPRKSKG